MISEDDYYHEGASYELPTPELEPQPVTHEDYENCIPEKLELDGTGFLINRPEDNYWRDRLLSLLLRNQGLLRVVRMAPRELWEQALNQVYNDRNRTEQ